MPALALVLLFFAAPIGRCSWTTPQGSSCEQLVTTCSSTPHTLAALQIEETEARDEAYFLSS